MTPPTQSGGGSPRGQTLPDFAVGIAIFLITVTFVVLFLPQLTLPYQDQEQSVVAERVASDLGNHLLAAERPPSTLNETCTIAFFDRTAGGDCPFQAESLNKQVGITSTYSLNVTLRDAPSDAPESNVLYNTGEPVPENDRSVSMARQRATLGGEGVVIEVAVW